ncbi:hypothetical protein [Leyella stercorea]|jgi:hypothetical protein|uniref:hypothetical protein n=1 Tax=Leyella stercorea TaxID=363265 RepID=UPI00352088E9
MEILKLVIDKLSQYNFLTNILPGTVLCIILKYLVGYDLIPDDYYQAGIVFYFVGMVNSRVGSLVIEPILKAISWVKFAPYSEFLRAEKEDAKLTILSQENNVFRSYISLMFISILGYIYKNCSLNLRLSLNNESLVLIVILFVLFLFAYKKQTSFVRKRVENFIKNKSQS